MDETRAKQLLEGVLQAYTAAALDPAGKHPFPVGFEFAQSLGYPSSLLLGLPRSCWEAFAGVSNVSVFAEIRDGDTVLDLGCGAGLDTLIAAEKAGPRGKVIAVDFSPDMLARASQAATEAGLNNIDFYECDAEKLPVEREAVDVALANGIFNLNPGRESIFHELARVIKPGGSLYAAEIVLKNELPEEEKQKACSWFA